MRNKGCLRGRPRPFRALAASLYLRLSRQRLGFIIVVCQEDRGTEATGVAARLQVGDSLQGEILEAAAAGASPS
jgi:hypothetical protein